MINLITYVCFNKKCKFHLKNSMSLVSCRSSIPDEMSAYGEWCEYYHSYKIELIYK